MLVAAATFAIVSPAQAAYCPSGYFCLYPDAGNGGTPQNIYYYTYQWTSVTWSLDDNAESSIDNQYNDPWSCPTLNHPVVWGQDTDSGWGLAAYLGATTGWVYGNFNSVASVYFGSRGSAGYQNWNNKIDYYYNECR